MSTVQTICESGMHFLCDPRYTFFVEKYVHGTGLQGVKSVEFIRKKSPGLICLVEAKTSAPHPKEPSPDNFKQFIGEIAQKAIDGFSLLLSVIISRRNADLGELLASVDYAKTDFCFVLVIKNHEKDWLPDVHDALKEYLRHFFTAWNWGSRPVLVLNEEMAVQCGLILAPTDESE